jgi:hypothetical protein
MKKQISIDYCALKYLNNYLENEKQIIDAYRFNNYNWDIENFKKFVTYFKVARNINKLTNENSRYNQICKIINNFKLENNIWDSHSNLVNVLQKIYNKELKSLSSKLLWYKKTDFVIYDSQSSKGLKSLSIEKITNYESYCKIWKAEFKKYDKGILNSCDRLRGLKQYTLYNNFDEGLLKTEWFQQRVFDTFLRENGKNNYASRN